MCQSHKHSSWGQTTSKARQRRALPAPHSASYNNTACRARRTALPHDVLFDIARWRNARIPYYRGA